MGYELTFPKHLDLLKEYFHREDDLFLFALRTLLHPHIGGSTGVEAEPYVIATLTGKSVSDEKIQYIERNYVFNGQSLADVDISFFEHNVVRMSVSRDIYGFYLESFDQRKLKLHCIQVKLGGHHSKLIHGNFLSNNDRTESLAGLYRKYEIAFDKIKTAFNHLTLEKGDLYLYSNKKLASPDRVSELPQNFELVVGEEFLIQLGLNEREIQSLALN
ncbi:hypothetical protein GEMRC1_009892 [Eukaryota sp. GEM-RC1]